MRNINNLIENGILITDIVLPKEKLYDCRSSLDRLMLNKNCHSINNDNFIFIKNPLLNDCFAELITLEEILQIPRLFFGNQEFFLGTVNLRRSKYTEAIDTSTTLYHRDQNLGDLDSTRGNFLKVFIYLTDVYSENGPFTYITKSHKDRRESETFYRVPDHEVYRLYGEKSELKCIAPFGTVITADTTGLHKGTKVSKGYRDMFTINFCTKRENNTDKFHVRNNFLQTLSNNKKQLFRYYSKV